MDAVRRWMVLLACVAILVAVTPTRGYATGDASPTRGHVTGNGLPPARPQALWVGIGLAGGSLLLLLAWAILSTSAARRRASPVLIGGMMAVRHRPWWRHWGWAVLLSLLALWGLFQVWQYIGERQREWAAYQTHIRPGVHVGEGDEYIPTESSATPPPSFATPEAEGRMVVAGIDASGMTADQLRQTVETRAIAPYRRDIVVRYLDRTATLHTDDLGLRTNLDAIIARAVAIGQEQDVREGFGEFLLRNPQPFAVNLPLTMTFDYDLLGPWVAARAEEIDRPAVEHAFDEPTLTWTRGQPGVYLLAEEAKSRLQAAVPDLEVHEVELPVTYTQPRAWSDEEIRLALERATVRWNAPPQPAAGQQITISFDAERWIGTNSPAVDWQPTREMTGYTFLPGRMGWTLDITAAQSIVRTALDTDVPSVTMQVFTDVLPTPLTLTDVKPLLLQIAAHFDGFTGFYVQDLTAGQEIRHNTYVTTSGMSMIKVAVMATAYRTLTQPFDLPLQDAMSQMIAYSINEKSNAVILRIGEGNFQHGLERVNETLQALGMVQTYIRSAYRPAAGPSYEPIPIPERPVARIPPEEQIDLWPDTSMQTSLSDQVILFEALYRGAQGMGRLLAAYPNLTPQDCQAMLDLLKTNPTRTFLGPGFADDVPMAHKNGFGGGSQTDERMNVGIIWPPGGRPYLVGLYQWDKVDWIHWLRVWPQQIEFSTTLYAYFTMPPPLPSPGKPTP